MEGGLCGRLGVHVLSLVVKEQESELENATVPDHCLVVINVTDQTKTNKHAVYRFRVLVRYNSSFCMFLF